MKVDDFSVRIDEGQLDDLRKAVAAARLPPDFYEGTQPDLGVTSQWMKEAKRQWETTYDWRKFERKLNTFQHFKADVPYNDGTYGIHFIHARSGKTDAVPLMLLHGWPGSLIEFLSVIEPLRNRGFSVVVPSLPGYAWSDKPPTDRHFGIEECAKVVDALMRGLGYMEYAVQGGDIGSPIARELATRFSACKAIHTNYAPRLTAPEGYDETKASSWDQSGLERSRDFRSRGNAYALEHGSRPSTISHVLASSPVALLAWIGEKFLSWTDETPSTEQILDFVTLWWLTVTFPFSIWAYRELYFGGDRFSAQRPDNYINKPFGHSSFPYELMRYPMKWVAGTGNLVWSREHSRGGHFAAFERPDDFVQDMVDAFAVMWPKRG